MLLYLHPVVATAALVLAWVVFRQGFVQRTQRLRQVPAPPGSRARHVALGPWSVGLLVVAALSGVLSAVTLRDWKPLGTVHGKVGVLSAALFGVLWWLGRRLVNGERALANRHGVLGVLALFAAGLTGILGIALLP